MFTMASFSRLGDGERFVAHGACCRDGGDSSTDAMAANIKGFARMGASAGVSLIDRTLVDLDGTEFGDLTFWSVGT